MGTFTSASLTFCLRLQGRKGQAAARAEVGVGDPSSWRIPKSLTPTLAPRSPRTWNAGPAASTSKKKTSKTASSPSVPYETMKDGSRPLQMPATPSSRRRCVWLSIRALPPVLSSLWSFRGVSEFLCPSTPGSTSRETAHQHGPPKTGQ